MLHSTHLKYHFQPLHSQGRKWEEKHGCLYVVETCYPVLMNLHDSVYADGSKVNSRLNRTIITEISEVLVFLLALILIQSLIPNSLETHARDSSALFSCVLVICRSFLLEPPLLHARSPFLTHAPMQELVHHLRHDIIGSTLLSPHSLHVHLYSVMREDDGVF